MQNSSFQPLEKSLEQLFDRGLAKGVFTAAACAIFTESGDRPGRLIKTWGRTRKGKKGEKVNPETIFDLASLTKPLCTTLSILCLIDQGVLDWSDSLDMLLRAEIEPGKRNIRLDQLLSHSSGLRSYRPYFAGFAPEIKKDNKKNLIKALLEEPLAYEPGSECRYSDLGFMLLGEVVERVSGRQLDTFFNEKIIKPLKIEEAPFFSALNSNRSKKTEKFAATENCPWRGRVMQGEVHDEHAWLMGGVAGHAGLFGTIRAVLLMTEKILHQWQGQEKHPAYSTTTLQRALKKKYSDQTWCLGFDTPTPGGSTGGKYLSPQSVGHLGYTGTSFWIDPERDLVMILLTNRVHPTRKNEQIRIFRPLFHDTVVEGLTSR
ncbi:penicillin-binding protein 4* [bacterium BMS3Bbin14]|nr:penicillin-binding protein 4* [bacterium BMS3Bbin14]